MENNSPTMYRKYLVDNLKELLSDEYVPSDIAYATNEEIINMIIDAALYYKDAYNN
jgi:hypothetical protein